MDSEVSDSEGGDSDVGDSEVGDSDVDVMSAYLAPLSCGRVM